MSPPGGKGASPRDRPERAKEPLASFAFARSDAPNAMDPQAVDQRYGQRLDQLSTGRDSLPLRLSVAQGGLGLELSRSIDLGPILVEELDVALVGVSYPVDLSKGVKQFRSRRGRLRHALLRLDLGELSKIWAQALEALWGCMPRVRLKTVFETQNQSGASEVKSQGEGRTPSALSVVIYSESSVLAFDLVLCSGAEPRLVVDSPRQIGDLPILHGCSALALALRALDCGLSQAAQELPGLRRHGRAVEIVGLAQAMALNVLPALGCRLPQVEKQVVQSIETEGSHLRVNLGAQKEPFQAGARALRVTGVADFCAQADEWLALGDFAKARTTYLEALEAAPGHPEILQELAELDLAHGQRAESALSFLQELEGLLTERSWGLSHARLHLAMGAALRKTGRETLARESFRKAALLEAEPVLSALVSADLSVFEDSKGGKRKLLDEAVRAAPYLRRPRLLRFENALETGDLKTACADAEQLEALDQDNTQRSATNRRIGQALLEAGQVELAQKWLKRALRLCPESPSSMISLARSLSRGGELHRASELIQTALRQLGRSLEEQKESKAPSIDVEEVEELRALSAEAHFLLAGWLNTLKGEFADILAHLSAIDTRSRLGADARLMETELLANIGRFAERDQALSRLLEAIELGWVSLDSCRMRLQSLIEKSERTGDSPTFELAARLLAT